jgi:hypothetical protein
MWLKLLMLVEVKKHGAKRVHLLVNSQCALGPQAKQNEKKRASHSVQPTACSNGEVSALGMGRKGWPWCHLIRSWHGTLQIGLGLGGHQEYAQGPLPQYAATDAGQREYICLWIHSALLIHKQNKMRRSVQATLSNPQPLHCKDCPLTHSNGEVSALGVGRKGWPWCHPMR